MVYSLMFISGLVLTCIAREMCSSKTKYMSEIIIIFAFFCMFAIYAFRGVIGIDYNAYMDIYEKISRVELNQIFNVSENIGIEFGYLFVNFISYKLGMGIGGVYFFCAIIQFVFLFKAVKYYDSERKFIILTFIIFVSQIFFSGLDAVRQMVAICMFFYATKFIKEKNIWRFIIVVLLGTLFHKSILFTLPLYFILEKKISPITYTVSALIFLIISKFFSPSDIVTMLFKNTNFADMNYLKYFVDDHYYGSTVGVVYYLYLIMGFVFTIYQYNIKNKYSIIPVNLFLMYIILFPLFTPYLSTKRISYYFFIGGALGIPIGISSLKKVFGDKYKYIYILMGMFFTVLFFQTIKSGYTNLEWLHEPYRFIWQ